ncbi:hypothetical protein HED60_05410 [Planctomycetales bacterium ZRK34]|nr:hypothetical protein HED60_05410 [Planctomycetales bacterium ZRK34]
MDSDWFNAAALADLLESGRSDKAEWSDNDLTQILEHQLDTTIPAELSPILAEGSLASRSRAQSLTFRDLIFTDTVSVQVLKAVKNHFKKLHHSDNHSLPPEISTALYYAAIAAAYVFHKVEITSAELSSVQSGMAWLCKQSWINSDLHALYTATVSGTTDHAT